MNQSSPTALIFRKRLLSYSETFIADQGQFLPRYRPVYCGYHQDDTGIGLIRKSPRVLLDQCSMLAGMDKLLFRLEITANKSWLRQIRRHDPRLVHAHFFKDGLDGAKLAHRLGIPGLVTLHGHDITKRGNTQAQSKGNQQLFSRVDRVIAVSRFIADQALARGCPEDKLEQHYIGIDLDKFNQQKTETTEPSLLFVGRLVEKKGCTYILQAMEKLRHRFPELTLTLVGAGGLRNALQQEAEARRLRVEFVGVESAEKIRERLARAWLFVAPSVTADDGDAEGLGMVFLEAQAVQTPVISFRSGGVVEAVADGVTGLLCAEKDSDALAENIASLLENNQLRHQMGKDGRLRIEQQFDVRKQCAKLERIYDELC